MSSAVSIRTADLVTGRRIATWSIACSWKAAPVSLRIPDATTTIGTLSIIASAIPESACVTPAPGTTTSTPISVDDRAMPSAMKAAPPSCVTRIGSMEGDESMASQSSMLWVPGIPKTLETPSSSRARTTSSEPLTRIRTLPSSQADRPRYPQRDSRTLNREDAKLAKDSVFE